MLTSILSAICAAALSASAMTSSVDTMNVYMINGDTVENFDGSQLVGKTISDYKTMICKNTVNGVVSITKVHAIRTDGKKTSAAETDDDMVIIIDGKKSSAEEMKKIKPEMVDAVTVFDAGSEGAAKWTDSKDKKVVVIQLRK